MRFSLPVELLTGLESHECAKVAAAVCRLTDEGKRVSVAAISRLTKLNHRTIRAAFSECVRVGLLALVDEKGSAVYRPGSAVIDAKAPTHEPPNLVPDTKIDESETLYTMQGQVPDTDNGRIDTLHPVQELLSDTRYPAQDFVPDTNPPAAEPAAVSCAPAEINPGSKIKSYSQEQSNGNHQEASATAEAPTLSRRLTKRERKALDLEAFELWHAEQPEPWRKFFDHLCCVCRKAKWRFVGEETRQDLRSLADRLLAEGVTTTNLNVFGARWRTHPFFGECSPERPKAQNFTPCAALVGEHWSTIMADLYDEPEMLAEAAAVEAAQTQTALTLVAASPEEHRYGSHSRPTDAASRRAVNAAGNRALIEALDARPDLAADVSGLFAAGTPATRVG